MVRQCDTGLITYKTVTTQATFWRKNYMQLKFCIKYLAIAEASKFCVCISQLLIYYSQYILHFIQPRLGITGFDEDHSFWSIEGNHSFMFPRLQAARYIFRHEADFKFYCTVPSNTQFPLLYKHKIEEIKLQRNQRQKLNPTSNESWSRQHVMRVVWISIELIWTMTKLNLSIVYEKFKVKSVHLCM